MPFTASHAAAVLPFKRTRLIWSALVIGSFGPDFQYFLTMSGKSRSWHHRPDVFLHCLPFTVIAFFIFEWFIRRPATGLLPQGFQRRLSPASSPIPKSLVEVLALLGSLVVGIGTHLLWDAFTHPHSLPWQHISALRESVDLPYGPELRGFEIAQEISSIAGLLILTIAILRWYGRTPARSVIPAGPSSEQKIALGIASVVIALSGAAWRCYSVIGLPLNRPMAGSFQVLFVISAIACFLWELLAYGLIMTMFRTRKEAHR